MHFQSAEGRQSGLPEGKCSALLTILHARGIVVRDVLHERVVNWKDSALLDQWIARVITAASPKDVFRFDWPPLMRTEPQSES